MFILTQRIGFGGKVSAWTTAAVVDLDANGFGGFQTVAFRQRIEAAQVSKSGSRIRMRFESSTQAGTDFGIDNAFVGHAAASGNLWDFDGGQVRVTFGGTNGFQIAISQTTASDEIAFNTDETKPLIVAFDWADAPSKNCRSKATETGYAVYTKTGVNEADQTAPTGYTTAASNAAAIRYIEVFGAN